QNLELIPQCSNRKDDDGDGLIDLADPDCTGPLDATESGTGAPPPPTAPTTPDKPAGNSGGGKGTSNTSNAGSNNNGGGSNGGGTVGSTGGGRVTSADGSSGSGGTSSGSDETDDAREPMDEPSTRKPNGAPTNSNPGLTVADFGPAPVGVPNFVIDQFSIPPFL